MADESIAARVRELLHYDTATGAFYRKVRLAQRHKVGSRADFLVTGGNNAGYRRVSFDSKRYMAHRVAWLYVHGEWPEKFIDHINGDKSDNRIENLREADPALNAENTRQARKNNKTGLLGVYLHTQGKYVARIQKNGKGKYIGIFECPEDAHDAYLKEKRRLHEGCTI